MLDKQVMICDAIIDILKIFADSEIGGQFELDYTAIGKYLESARSAVDYFECSTKEEVYERFTEDIYAGFPVWRFLVLPKWTMDMVEQSFKSECEQEYQIMQNRYKCLSCKYYSARETMVGILQKCTYKCDSSRDHRLPESRETVFQLKKHCKNYFCKN